MKRIFISGPYSSDPAVNVPLAIDAMHALMDAGFAPMCPHLTHFAHLQRERPYREWMALDAAWLRVSEAVVRLPGMSPGADEECALARSLGIPVFGSAEEITLLTGWPSPTALSFADSHRPGNNRSMNATMELLTGWPTAMMNDATGSTHCYAKGNHDEIVLKLPGAALVSSSAGTGNSGGYQLNPAMSRWLQSYPQAWDRCSPGWLEWRQAQFAALARIASAG